MEKVKVAVIGCGSIGPFHAASYSALENAELIAACDINEAAMKSLGDQYGLDKLYANYEDLLADEDIDAVSVCVPNRLHSIMTIAALQAGKHVLCEKPTATSTLEVEEMFEAQAKASKKLMVGLTRRFGADANLLKAHVEAGELGQIYYAKCGYLRRSGIPGMGSWFTTKSEGGAGPIYDIGVHTLDLTLWFMDNFKPASVLAASYAKFGPLGKGGGDWGTPVPGGPYDVEDLGTALIRMQDGASVAFEASWAAHVGAGQFYSTLIGDKAGADLGTMTIFTEEQGHFVDKKLHSQTNDPYLAEAKHFVECIIEDKEPVTTADQMVGLQKALDAILKSAETGEWVKIE